MRKTPTIVLIFVMAAIVCLPLGANVFGNSAGALVYGTPHFDFIYQESSALTAMSLASYAEQAYAEITGNLGADPQLHLPVVITPAAGSLNAYYTGYPYPRIVMLDTIKDSGALADLEGGLKKVFYHELSHAISLNIRSQLFKELADFFGSWVNVSLLLYLNQSFVEGLAVAFESLDGGGRMNDPYCNQFLMQARIEGADFSWLDISGQRDIKPVGNLPYLLGGAFSYHLIGKYGMERYSQFIRSTGGLSFNLIGGLFKKAFGVSINREFSEFYNSIAYPQDLGSIGEEVFSAVYIDRLAGGGGTVAVSDSNSPGFVFIGSDGEILSTEPFYSDELRYSISPDGSVRAKSLVGDTGQTVIVEGVIRARFDRLLRPCLIQNSDGYLIGGITKSGTAQTVCVIDLQSMQPVAEVPVPIDTTVYETAALEGKLALLASDGSSSWQLLILNPADGSLSRVEIPQNVQIRTISADGQALVFSYYDLSEPISMARYGRLDPDGDGYALRLCRTDISGGVDYPVVCGKKVFFISRYLEYESVRMASENEFSLDEGVHVNVSAADWSDPHTEELEKDLEAFIGGSGVYRPASYFTDGYILPFVGAQDMIGAYYLTEDPAERIFVYAGLGGSIENRLLGMIAGVEDSSTRLTFGLPVVLSADVFFGFSAGKPIGQLSVDASSAFYIGRGSGETLNLDAGAWYSLEQGQGYLTLNASAGLSRVRKWKLNTMERLGHSLSLDWSWQNPGNTVSVNADLKLYFPGILPLKNPVRFCFNWPVTAGLKYSVMTGLLSGSLGTVVFGWEIQKSVYFLAMYINRIYVSIGAESDMDLSDITSLSWSVSALANVEISFVLGQNTQSSDMRLYCGARFCPEGGWGLSFGLGQALY